ncbi:DUF1616 domain-containing protein [Halobacteriales archaeon Cl-PHB]
MVSRNNTKDRTTERVQTIGSLMAMVKAYPRDLAVLTVSVVLAGLAIVALPAGTTPRMLLAAPLVLLWPGYALVSLLFPKATRATFQGLSDGLFKTALAFGTSLAVVPLTIVAVGAIVPLTVANILGSLLVLTLAITQVAAVRQIRYRSYDRGQTTTRQVESWVSARFAGRSGSAKLSVVLLTGALIVAMGTVGMALAHPPAGNDFTNFYLATEDDEGSLQTAGYPSNLTRGEPVPLVAVVANEEGVTQTYHLVVQLQQVEDGAVVRRTELARFANVTRVGEQWRNRHTIRPEWAGENLRLSYLLYSGSVPERPTRTNAYRHLHLWVDVENATDGA